MTTRKEPGGGFWTFDTILDAHFNVPSAHELALSWQEHNGAKDFVNLDSIFGVCEQPSEKPSVIISLDLCEIVRETGPSLTRIYSHETPSAEDEYGVYYGDKVLGGDAQMARGILLPHLMHLDHVSPVPFSEAIAAFIGRWREHGAFIIANTSTLPGCELSTVRFLSEHYPRVVQGILFPRNHDGQGPTTKAAILQDTIGKISQSTGYNLSTTPTLAIEDAYHHAVGYTEDPNDIQVFMPAYSWNLPLENTEDVIRVEQQFGTLDTFIAVDEYLQSCGIVK